MVALSTQNQSPGSAYTVDVDPLDSIERLRTEWHAIESQSDLPFFLTWAWISTWIDALDPTVIVVRVFDGDTLAAIGLFTKSRQRRHGVLHTTQLRLFQVGDNLVDQVWIEYNNLACLPGHERTAIVAAVRELDSKAHQWDEIIISMMPESLADHVTAQVPGSFADGPHPCYVVDLQDLRARGQDYLSSLSSNTRYQVRYAMRRYESKYGPLHMERAQDARTALAFFHEAGPLHIDRWDDSGYKNPSFVRFHEFLIERHLGDGVELLRIRSGDTTVGILYFHIVGERVYFYLHGLMFDDDPKLKPGLVLHSLACEYFLERGKTLYDFMGGYSRYKLQLASPTESLVTVSIQRPRVRFAIERMARRFRDRWMRRRGTPQTRTHRS